MRFSHAVGLSLGAHAALAALIVVYLRQAPAPETLVQLDLSSVELSFAEKVEDAAPVRPAPPPPPAPAPQPRPAAEPPRSVERVRELPPELEAVRIPTPEPEAHRMQPPPAPAVPQAAPRQAKIDAPPSPRKTIRPDYPKGARTRGEQGDIIIELTVAASGGVSAASVVTSSGYSELDEAALKAVRAARFRPARANGEAVASTARLTLSFRLK